MHAVPTTVTTVAVTAVGAGYAILTAVAVWAGHLSVLRVRGLRPLRCQQASSVLELVVYIQRKGFLRWNSTRVPARACVGSSAAYLPYSYS